MDISKRLPIIRNIVEGSITALGYILVDVTVESEDAYNGQKSIVVSIDKEGGITIEDCVKVTKKIKPLLDEEDIIPDSYIFTVSSPGSPEES